MLFKISLLLALFKNTIILFVCPSKILHKHCFQFLLGQLSVPRENKNNTYAKFWRDKQRVLWYFLIGLISLTLLLANMTMAKDSLLIACAFCVVICFFTFVAGKLNSQESPNPSHWLIVLRIPCDRNLLQLTTHAPCLCLNLQRNIGW